jgi:hypothetical protein
MTQSRRGAKKHDAVQQSVIDSRNGFRRPNGSDLIGIIAGRRVGAWRIS